MISTTLDGWTRCDNKSFISITAHFVDEDWKMRSSVLRATALSITVDDESEVPHEDATTLLLYFNETMADAEARSWSLTTDAASVMDSLRKQLPLHFYFHSFFLFVDISMFFDVLHNSIL